MGKILEIIVNDNQVISINDHSMKADANGLIRVDVDDVTIQENRGLLQFDVQVDTEKMLNKMQRIMFYELVVDWSQFGKLDLIEHIGIDRESVHKVVTLACIHRVLVKAGHQWKARKEIKDAIRALITKLSHSNVVDIPKFEEEEVLPAQTKETPIRIKDINAISEADIPKRKVIVKKEKPMSIPRRK